MRRSGKQFVYRVERDENTVKLGAAARPYKLPRTPRGHKWAVGDEVVYVQRTAAGWMPTSLTGTITAFIVDGRQRKACVEWHKDTEITPTIALQRLRPFCLLYDHPSCH